MRNYRSSDLLSGSSHRPQIAERIIIKMLNNRLIDELLYSTTECEAFAAVHNFFAFAKNHNDFTISRKIS